MIKFSQIEEDSGLIPEKKSSFGYIEGWIIIILGISGLMLVPFLSLLAIIAGIICIYRQRKDNRAVQENNVLYKYRRYLDQFHSSKVKYYKALRSYLHYCHYSTFGGFDENTIFSPDELDELINEFMKDKRQNLKYYELMQMNRKYDK